MEIIESFKLLKQGNLGKKASKLLRREGRTPSNVYGNGIKGSIPVTIDFKQVEIAFKQGCFYSRLFKLEFEGKTINAFAREVLLHPVKSYVMHVDFFAVDIVKSVKMTVPIRFINIDKSNCIKFGGKMNVVKRRVFVTGLPGDIPKILEANLQNTQTGDVIKSADLLGLPDSCKLSASDVIIVTLKGKKGATVSQDEDDKEAVTDAK